MEFIRAEKSVCILQCSISLRILPLWLYLDGVQTTMGPWGARGNVNNYLHSLLKQGTE